MLWKQRELWILYLSMVFSILWPQVQAIRQMRLCFCSRAPERPAFWPQMHTGGWKVNVVRKGETLCFNIINQTLFLNVCSSRIPLVSMVAQTWFWHRGCLGNRHKHLTGSVRQKTGKKQMVTYSPFCLLKISFVSCSIFQYMQVCKNWTFIKRLAKCGFLAKLLERLPRQGSRSAPLWVTFALLGWFFWACGNLMGGWILLCQDTPVRRWSLAGILGWDVEKVGVHGTLVTAETFPAEGCGGGGSAVGQLMAGLASAEPVATRRWPLVPGPLPSLLCVKDQLPSLFLKSLNTVVMQHPGRLLSLK